MGFYTGLDKYISNQIYRGKNKEFIKGYRYGFKEAEKQMSPPYRQGFNFPVGLVQVRFEKLALDPLNEPFKFGHGMGFFFGTIKYCGSGRMLTDDQLYGWVGYTIQVLLRKIKGFDMNIVKKSLEGTAKENLVPGNLLRLNELIKLI